MSQITNDIEFKKALQNLDAVQQRVVAAMFVEHVLSLSDDKRLNQAIAVAADSNASAGDIANALKLAKAATNDSHVRCGAECNWAEQAGYFVARATIAALTPLQQSISASPAWQAAMSSRMAQTSMLIDNESTQQGTHTESEWQYETLSNYLKS
ncbi:MAG: hypothetical protein LJE83_02315 [Gammaproteobacteria bacterium]|nr:hypothetical protein [Gammaproteobacteria bacterium]